MLAALEKGVKGDKWFSLIDKVYAPAVLHVAFLRVKANGGAPGVDRQTIEMFEKRLGNNLSRLSDQLQKGTYRPQAIRRTYIPKPGSNETRPLGIPTVRDRVVQTALRAVIEPIFEGDFAGHSYGFRPGRGCKDALRRVADGPPSAHWIVGSGCACAASCANGTRARVEAVVWIINAGRMPTFPSGGCSP